MCVCDGMTLNCTGGDSGYCGRLRPRQNHGSARKLWYNAHPVAKKFYITMDAQLQSTQSCRMGILEHSRFEDTELKFALCPKNFLQEPPES